ncbi:hypothetical protein KAS41_02360 [Candidatus Parcubacteria bacterium]|nr:hypothetical protein [Candidatus Parcubacteria bacterium]
MNILAEAEDFVNIAVAIMKIVITTNASNDVRGYVYNIITYSYPRKKLFSALFLKKYQILIYKPYYVGNKNNIRKKQQRGNY